MHQFLLYIGIYNLVGALLLMFLNNEKLADILLRKYIEIVNEPYSHGAFGRLWLWWAASSNLFLGLIMILATRWEEKAQKEVIIMTLITYLIMYVVMIVGAKKPKFGRGIITTHFLWIIQIAWGLWSIFS